MKYQNLRGGKVVFSAINRPPQQEWSTPLVAFEFVLNLEKQVNQVDYRIWLLQSFHLKC